MIRIESIDIENIGPIDKIKLDFNPEFNIICGQNGVGKTTILDCIAQSFNRGQTSLKRKANSDNGKWTTSIKVNNNSQNYTFQTNSFRPNDNRINAAYLHQNSGDVIVFKTYRNIGYQSLSSVNRDPEKNTINFAKETLSGTLSNDLKQWFVNRHLWSAHDNGLSENQQKNIDLAKSCFSMLNDSISFNKVDPGSYDIMLNTPHGEIFFEYLSSGYKSCLAVLLGIIKEIEYRYKDPNIYANDFDGVILIDEIDLHLHPEWQAKIYSAIKSIIPNAQVFTSSHSPHLIQVANPKEIIPLVVDENSIVSRNEMISSTHGCQGWSIEEILSDVMGLKETRTEFYKNSMQNFNKAIDEENYEQAKEYFDIISGFLHPNNQMQKILEIQLTGLRDD